MDLLFSKATYNSDGPVLGVGRRPNLMPLEMHAKSTHFFFVRFQLEIPVWVKSTNVDLPAAFKDKKAALADIFISCLAMFPADTPVC